ASWRRWPTRSPASPRRCRCCWWSRTWRWCGGSRARPSSWTPAGSCTPGRSWTCWTTPNAPGSCSACPGPPPPRPTRREEPHEYRRPARRDRPGSRRALLPHRLGPVPHLRPDGRAELRARRVPVHRRLRHLVGQRPPARRRLRRVRLPGVGGVRRRRRNPRRDPGGAGGDPSAVRAAPRTDPGHGGTQPGRARADPGGLGRRPADVPASGARLRHRVPAGGGHPHRPVPAHRGRRTRPRRPAAVRLPHPLRPHRARRRGGPGHGHRARHRRAQVLHPGLRDRRCGGGARGRARRPLLRRGHAVPGHLAADLRVHRGRDRRHHVHRGLRGRVGGGRHGPAVRQLLHRRRARRHRRGHRARRRAADTAGRAGRSDRREGGMNVDTEHAPRTSAPAAAQPIVDVRRTRRVPGWAAPAVVAVLLLSLPFSTLSLPGLFEGTLNSPSTLHLLATCLVFGGLATSYDLLYGRVGLLSFGHALYFAAGAYLAALLMWTLELPLLWSALIAVASGTALALVLGAVSLRVSGIALAMVTLAFAQAGSILVIRDPGRMTGGEEGLALNPDTVPGAFIGVVNTVNLYWPAVGYVV